MAENVNPLILPIGADVRTFKESINNVKDALKSLQQDLAGKRFDLITDKEKKLLEDYSRTLKTLQGDLSGTAQSFNKTTESSKKTRTALTSLSLVVQDLPFGFIAIQNNLPNLISAFGELQRTGGGVKGALGQLVASLTGPAGLFLAFSAATAAVTFAIQKYGSFGAAVDALFGKINPLKDTIDRVTKSYEEYNKQVKSNAEINALAQKSSAGLIETVKILSQGATDLSKSEKERGDYLNQLKEIDKDYFGRLSSGKDNVDLIKKATDLYTQSLIANARVKAFQTQLDAIEAQIVPLETLRNEYKKSQVEAEKLRKTSNKIFVDPTEAVKSSLGQNAIAIENLYQKRQLLIDGLNEAIDAFKGFVKPQKDVKDAIIEINNIDLTGYYSIESILKRITDAANTVLDASAPLKDRVNALKDIKNEDKDYFKNLEFGKTSLNDIKNITEEYLHVLQILRLEQKGRIEATKLQEQADKNAADALKKRIEEEKKLEKEFFAQANQQMGLDADTFFKKSVSAIENVTLELDKLQKSFIATKDILTSVFFSPLQDLFTNFLDTGKFTFQEFAKSVLNSIKKIVAQFAATQIIQLLAQLLNPMGTIASTGILNNASGILGRRDRGIQGAFNNILIGRSMNPNVGSIQKPLTSGGQVNFVIRGTDLVGVLNRGNQEINRIG